MRFSRVLATAATLVASIACAEPVAAGRVAELGRPSSIARIEPIGSGVARTLQPTSDPLALARGSLGRVGNREAVIPVQCYTKTDGVSNPCWTCHTSRNGGNAMEDWALQKEYAFSELGLTNHWTNLFVDRSSEIAAISDAAVLDYIRTDNYSPLRDALHGRADYRGWRPDLDFSHGFDELGLARDGSWWRALRFKPFPGTFWPTNGSSDDAYIRLPRVFYTDREGATSVEVYKVNLAILETALTVSDTVADGEVLRRVEPVDESIAQADLDRDGEIAGRVQVISGLPSHYVGAAAPIPVHRHRYPTGTEFLHTVRYLDPDAAGFLSARMKEVRYSVKRAGLDDATRGLAYDEEKHHKDRGVLPSFTGSPELGLMNGFGWQLQGFIEDGQGRLRLQTHEEHVYCMGCHSSIGVTVDSTFSFPRKLPGAAGWGMQTLAGQKDVPQAGHAQPEVVTYFRRVGGGDELRANEEILRRFFHGGQLDEARVRRAAPGGDRDLAWLLAPSTRRATDLNKTYLALVRSQSFEFGRDTTLSAPINVHRTIVKGATGFTDDQVFRDGRLWLEWPPPKQ